MSRSIIVGRFPNSSAVPSTYFQLPGTTEESTRTVRKLLEENDRGYDIYEKARYAHNHFAHSILTRYALGAPKRLLEDTWKHDQPHLATLDPEQDERKTGDLSQLPEKITVENWDDPKTLGNKDAYSLYLDFFHAEIRQHGPIKVFKAYVFSPHANWESKNGHPPPQMTVRLVAGVFHPFIHIGFGLEFRDIVVLAEGLAEAAIHDHGIMTKLFPSDWPKQHLRQTTESKTQIKQEIDEWSESRIKVDGVRLLEIYDKFQNEQELSPVEYDPDMSINERLTTAVEGHHGEKILELIAEWDLSDEALKEPSAWEEKLKEIGVLVTLLACATGRQGHSPRIDFFLMHTLTSSIFLPAFMVKLDEPERRALLTTYLAGMLSTAIARGKPKLDIDYLMSAPLYPVAPNSTPKGQGSDVLSDPADVSTRNLWGSIIESSLYATDSHVPKSIRSLAYYAQTMGSGPLGSATKSSKPTDTSQPGEEALPGSAKLDGTMFIRAAGLVMDTMGWCREGQKAGGWEFSPIGYDQVWK